MAFFKKSESLRDLVARLQNPGRLSPNELGETLDAVLGHPDASSRRLGFMLQSTHPRIRDAGIDYVRRNAGGEAVDLVVAAMETLTGTPRVELARVLLGLDREQVQRTLHRVFNGSRPELRALVLDVASVDPEWRHWLGVLRQSLKASDAVLRMQAARILRRRASDPAVAAILRDLLHDDDDGVRSEAIHGLCECPTAEIVEPFFARLSLESAAVQARMVQALGELSHRPGSDVEQHLFPVLSDENPDTRALAVKLLAKMPDSDRVLRRFLIHSRGLASWLRDRAIQSILQMAQSLTEPLVRLMEDPDEDVRVQALTLAARVEDPAVVTPAARIFCYGGDWWIRSIAAEILGRFANDEVLTLLLPFIDDPEMRYSVVSVLTKIDRPESTAHLIECLGDRARSIRSTALDGLAGRQHDEVIRAIATIARLDPEPSIRAKSVEVLRGFGEPAAALVRAIEAEAETAQLSRTATLDAELSMANDELNRPR